jgi:glycine betaine/choline ABC-type transport system substrate-binding protein
MKTYTITVSKFTNTVAQIKDVTDISTYVNACISSGYLKDEFDCDDNGLCFEALNHAYLLEHEADIQNVLNTYAKDGAQFCVTSE